MSHLNLRSRLLNDLSNLRLEEKSLLRSPERGNTIHIMELSKIEEKIKTTEITAFVAKSASAGAKLEKFLNDGGEIEFVSPRDGYAVRSELFYDKRFDVPVISLTREGRSKQDIAVSVAECLDGYSRNKHKNVSVYTSDNDSQAQEFGKMVGKEIDMYDAGRRMISKPVAKTEFAEIAHYSETLLSVEKANEPLPSFKLGNLDFCKN